MGVLESGGAQRLEPTREVFATSNRQITTGVYALRFPRPFDFAAGQVIELTVDPSVPSRCYSIASGSDDPEIELVYDLVPGGLLTPRLSALAPGDRLLVSDPFGSFLDARGASWWIATGTGVAPFVAMVRSGVRDDKTLIHGSRTLAGFYYAGLLSETLGEGYVRCCTSEAAPGVYRGRLTAWLEERPISDEIERYLLCGSAGMVVAVRDLLIGRGVPFERIVAEIYF